MEKLNLLVDVLDAVEQGRTTMYRIVVDGLDRHTFDFAAMSRSDAWRMMIRALRGTDAVISCIYPLPPQPSLFLNRITR